MTRDELTVMDGGKCILQLRGVRPFLSDKYDITGHPNYYLTADADDRNTFDMEKYLSRRMKLLIAVFLIIQTYRELGLEDAKKVAESAQSVKNYA